MKKKLRSKRVGQRDLNHERLEKVVRGILYDFAGFLTGRKEIVITSAKHHPEPILNALLEFCKQRGISDTGIPLITNWDRFGIENTLQYIKWAGTLL